LVEIVVNYQYGGNIFADTIILLNVKSIKKIKILDSFTNSTWWCLFSNQENMKYQINGIVVLFQNTKVLEKN
jgi:hypothetical protein